MPITPDAAATIPEWCARKDAQWERIAGAMPGLQLVRSRQDRSQYMLAVSLPPDDGQQGFYEGVIIGQLPEVVSERTRLRTGQVARKPMPEAKKPVDKRGIDLTDAEIDQVLACWKRRRSAEKLPFVGRVWKGRG